MKKFFIGAAAVVTVWALVLAGCPDNSAGEVTANCIAPASGDATTDLVFGDVTYTGCNQLTPTAKVFNSKMDSSEVTTIKEISGDGANGSATFFRLSTSDAALTHAGATLVFGADYDTTGKTLQFSVRATDGAANTIIRVFYEAEGGFPDQTAAFQVIKTFTTDGTWQDISILFSEFDFGPTQFTSGNITPETVRAIGFDLRDFNGATPGIGLQTIDIDEIRFVDPDLSYICANGTPASGTGTVPDMSNCQMCDQGFEIEGTAGDPGSTCLNELRYVCTNGMPASGTGATAGVSNCQMCDQGYSIEGIAGDPGSTCLDELRYVCTNGMPVSGNGATAGVSNCQMCDQGFEIVGTANNPGSTCVNELRYLCTNGMPASGTGATAGVSNCQMCDQGYSIEGTAGDPGSTCLNELRYVCTNGMPASGTGATAGVSNCQMCDQGFEIVGTANNPGSTCLDELRYICTNGTPASGTGATAGVSACDFCNPGHTVSGTPGAAGSTCVALSGCTAPPTGRSSSVSSIYTDGDYAACSAVSLAATNSFGVSSTDTMATFAEITTGGASGSARTLNNPTAANTAASGFITLAAGTDVSGKTLRFSIMSPASGGTTNGTSMVRVYLQADPGAATDLTTYQTETTEGIVTFTNDAMWQDVSISLDNEYSFTGANITAATVRTIGFAIVEDTNGNTAGLGVQTFSVDEVRIEDSAPNCTAPAAGTGPASVDLVWGDADYNSCSDGSSNAFVDISSSLYAAVHVPTRNAANRPPSPFTLLSNSSASGAFGTPLFTNLTLGSGNSAWAYVIADLPEDYGITGKSLKFSIKSPATGGTGSIGVFLEDSAGNRTFPRTATFTNDDTWQEISLSPVLLFFPVNVVGDRTAIRRVIFSLVDDNGLSVDGIGAQTFDIDEIRFE